MKVLDSGSYFGDHNTILRYKGLIITDTAYTHKYVGWHYHENPYFTFLLEGKLYEANRKESYYCNPGTLLFHNWQDAHYNVRHSSTARGLHIELGNDWLRENRMDEKNFEGSKIINNSIVKNIFLKIHHLISKGKPDASEIENLVIQLWSRLTKHSGRKETGTPNWVSTVREIVHSRFTHSISLSNLASYAGIHPVYLSSEFPRYFNATLGSYIRNLRIEKSLHLLANSELTLTQIAYTCGFSDQSHFIREFKKVKSFTPSAYRKSYLG